MPYCPGCGVEVEAEDAYCPVCDCKLDDPAESPVDRPQSVDREGVVADPLDRREWATDDDGDDPIVAPEDPPEESTVESIGDDAVGSDGLQVGVPEVGSVEADDDAEDESDRSEATGHLEAYQWPTAATATIALGATVGITADLYVTLYVARSGRLALRSIPGVGVAAVAYFLGAVVVAMGIVFDVEHLQEAIDWDPPTTTYVFCQFVPLVGSAVVLWYTHVRSQKIERPT